MRYSVQSRDRIFVKSYEYLSVAKNMGRNIGKNLRKNLSGRYSKKLIDYAKQYATNAFKTVSKRAIQKTGEETGDLIGNKTANKITKVSETSKQNKSKQLKMSVIKKYLKKDVHISKRKTKKY